MEEIVNRLPECSMYTLTGRVLVLVVALAQSLGMQFGQSDGVAAETSCPTAGASPHSVRHSCLIELKLLV
jgi:hypothetical protein